MMKSHYTRLLFVLPFLIGCLFLSNCTGVPEGIKPVEGFKKERYLGKWYEIARLDHSFERGLSNVSATYTARKDGGIKVLNRGYSKKKQKWNEAEGKAYFAKNEQTGHLKVSFFGPFYGSYVIFHLDKENYQYSYITSYNRKYLWFLSRTKTVSKKQRDHFIKMAKKLGFDTEALIFVDQDKK